MFSGNGDMMYAQGAGAMQSGFPSGPSTNMGYSQMNPPAPFPNYNLAQAQYASGGRVGMPQAAEALQGMGQRGDNILAYINPHEAAMLARTQGMDMNPMTGLPQFGLWDSLKGYGNQAYGALAPYANQAYGMAKNYGTGLVSQGLGALDKGVGYALQPIGAQIGTYLGGTSGGMIGGAGGKQLSSMYGNSGGMQGAFDRYMGGKPIMGNASPSSVAGGIGNAMYNTVGRPLVGAGLQRADQEVGRFLPQLGQHLGQQMGGGAGGMRMGNSIGQMAANGYQKAGGLSGQQGRMEGMAGMAPQVPAFAGGGWLSGLSDMLGGQNPPALPPRPAYQFPGGQHPYMPGPALPPRPPMGAPNLPPPPARGGAGPGGFAPPVPAFAGGGYADGGQYPGNQDFFFEPALGYKAGGSPHARLNNPKALAERLRTKGEGQDKILAHINPKEAEMLAGSQGMGFNDDTGLPQFGGLSHLFRKLRHSKFARKALPILGSVIGSAIGGPGGAVAGGALGKSLAHKNPLKGAAQGAIMGGVYGLAAPAIGNAMGISSTSGIGNALSLSGTPGLHRLGLEGLAGMGAGHAAIAGAGANQVMNRPEEAPKEMPQEEGLWGSLKGLGKDASDLVGGPLNLGLLGLTGMGMYQGSKKKKGQDHEQSIREKMGEEGIEDIHKPWAPIRKEKMIYREPPAGYRPGIDPQWKYYMTIDPDTGQDLYAAKGGYIEGEGHDGNEYAALGGYIHGDTSAQADDIDMTLQDGDYIMNGTDVSLLGDGNSLAGANALKQFEADIDHLPAPKRFDRKASGGQAGGIPAKVSAGEYRIPAEKVAKLGGGNPKKGAKKLDTLRKNLRKHKGVKKILPPKSKPVQSYMKGA